MNSLRSTPNPKGMANKTLVAKIRFLAPAEGGRSTPAQTGIRPHLKLGEVFTSCIVTSTGTVQTFEFGNEHEVNVEIPFWKEYGHLLRFGDPVELFDGSRPIARGTWVHG